MKDQDTQFVLLQDDHISNDSGNRPFQDVLATRISRRKAMAGGLAAAATTFLGGAGVVLAHGRGKGAAKKPAKGLPLIGFTPVANADGNGPLPAISPDYQFQVLIPWGDSLDPTATPFSYPPTADEQARRIGIGHDGMWYFPLDQRRHGLGGAFPAQRHGERSELGLLCINHEFGTTSHVLGKPLPESLDDVRTMQHAHGASVVAIARIDGTWRTVRSRFSRRIHGNTPVSFSGPAADSALLQTPIANPPQRTLNNCANGYTPWGTYLSCEENFNGYFGTTGPWTPSAEQQRYGLTTNGFGYAWHLFDERFDLSNPDYRNEENRFGWVVEIDPTNENDTPVKRTALGRFKHEGVAIVVGRGGRVVGYMGDDERFDYIYKFVSDGNWNSLRARGMSPLDHGKLYVARFDDDGSGQWLELSIDNPALAARFADQAELLIHARIAGDILGATPMDRPEWTTVAPNGDVYCALTNNSQRTVADAANPLAPNPDGHIIRWHDADDHVGTTFTWDIFLIAQDTHGTEDSYADPDGLWADPDGRLFIQTDGGQKDALNNQMLVADTETGELRRLFTGVTGDEITGIAITPDRRTMFINTQHPGNGNPSLTNWPVPNAVPDGVTVPRDCTFVITRKDGGIIGS